MPINVCQDIRGTNGSINVSPRSINTAGNEPITYTIRVQTGLNSFNFNGQFVIKPVNDSIKTGKFLYQFDDNQKRIYSIKETKDGFTFIFKSRNDTIVFNLFPENFSNPYEAALVVDGDISGFGVQTVSLDINPDVQLIQADNFEDYKEQFGLGDLTTQPPETQPSDAVSETNIKSKLDVTNEYNFYQKEFEETSLNEKQLLDINKNYTTFDIINYFKRTPTIIEQKDVILHTQDYMTQQYPIFDKQKNLFPMYMEIKFENDNSKAGLVSFLRKIGMLEYFCFMYVNFYNSKVKKENDKIGFENFINFISNSGNILDSDISSIFNGKISSIKSFLYKSLQKTLLIKIFQKQIKLTPNLIDDEILMYKVQKFKGNELLNTQYLINNLDNTEMIFFDTQLKYDIEYEYVVSKIELFSTEIKQSPIEDYTIKTRIIDSPPLPPDVNFIPFKGVDNQLMINLNTNVGRYSDYPIIIKDSDYPIFNKILEYKKYSRILLNENKVQFEADEGNFIFEMYRLENAPDSYSDFKDAYSVTTNFTSILDDIRPNQKYYYIFRARDIHGNLSNPTKPIEIELINENGTIFMLKKEYIFDEKEKIVSKIFKNVFQIKPSIEQSQINEQLSYEKDQITKNAISARQINMVLGNKEVSLWNKPFLIRVTSKKTGKKIDIKFKFTVSQPN